LKLRSMTSLYLLSGDRLILLRRNSGIAKDLYVAAAGGHFEESELCSPEVCVLREAKEELGLEKEDIAGLALRYIALKYANGEIRQNYYFFGRISPEKAAGLTSNEGELVALSPEKAPDLPAPFCPPFVLRHWLETGRYDTRLYGGAATADGLEFSPMD